MRTIIILAAFFSLAVSAKAQESKKIVYPLVVEFHSHCCGVPSEQPLLNYIHSFKKAQRIKKIKAWHIGPMGREGEYYLAFSLKELNKRQKKIFISNVKAVTAKMKDKGSASLSVNKEVDMEALSGRATAELQNL